jgi:hypothetical protein
VITESTACREAALAGRLTFLNTGTAGAAAILIFGGTRPASVADAPGSAPLASIELQNPAGTVAAGVLTLAAASTGMVATTGVAAWARVLNRDAATAFDMDAGDMASAAECKLSSVNLMAGGLVLLVSAALS